MIIWWFLSLPHWLHFLIPTISTGAISTKHELFSVSGKCCWCAHNHTHSKWVKFYLFPENSAACNASHDWGSCVQDGELLQEKAPVHYVRISSSLSCNAVFPSIMCLSTLLACPVENAWKCGTNAIVSVRLQGRLAGRVWATADLVLMASRFHCAVFLVPLNYSVKPC